MSFSQNHFAKASHLLDLRRHDLAEQELLAGLAADPLDPWAHAMLARCRSACGDHKGAHGWARRAIELAPGDGLGYVEHARTILLDPGYRPPGTGWLYRGWSGEETPRQREAERLLREAIRLDPADTRAYLVLAYALMEQESRRRDALKVAEAGLGIDPADADLQTVRGEVLALLGRFRQAEAAVDASLRLDPEASDTHSLRGRTLLARGRVLEAADQLNEALRLNPHDDEARAALFEALKDRPWPFRLAARLRAPLLPFYDFRKLGHAISWAVSWCTLGPLVLLVWNPPHRVAVALVAVCLWIGIGLPALAYSANAVAGFLLVVHPQGRRLLTVGQRTVRFFVFNLVVCLACAIASSASGCPASEAVFALVFAALPLAAAFALDRGPARTWTALYAALVASAAMAAGQYLPGGDDGWIRNAAFWVGVLLTLAPLSFLRGRLGGYGA